MAAAVPASRLAFIDQMRGLVTLLVVFHHTAITYGGAGGWYYREVVGRGITATTALLTLLCAVDQAWFMGAFFLVAGYVTPGPFDRKGAARYLRDRAIRLGVPLLVFGFFLDALTNSIADLRNGADLLAVFGRRLLQFDYRPGPLWFAQVLLLMAIAYAAWRWMRPAAVPEDDAPLPRHRTLLIAALVTGAAAFLIRLAVPVGQEYGHMQLGYFASYVVLFAAGCIAARHRWLARIEWPYARPWWIVALVTLPILPVAALAHRAITQAGMNVGGGFDGGSLLYAMWEPFVAWGTILALLWFLRTRVGADRMRHLSRRAFAIYCFHPPVVVGIAIGFRNWAAPDSIKFAVVGSLSCVVLYWMCGLLLRIPGVSRIW